jgi:methyltransferase (TIGR00027 family)
MDTSSGSFTSTGVAGLRAAHQLIDGEPKLLRDPVILQLLPSSILDHIRSHPEDFRKPGVMHLRSHVLLRSRYTEDCLAAAYTRGIRQYLLLGAGLDTYAWRQAPDRTSLRIFEVDHPATQAKLAASLAATGISMPENCQFVPIDFESTTLSEGLANSSFDFSVPSFISWLGVTVYLTMEAIDAVLAFVATLPAGTEMVFTFTQKRAAEGPMALRAAELGEPWITFFSPQELHEHLEKFGFSSISFLTPEEARIHYFPQRTDGLEAPLRTSIARVVV